MSADEIISRGSGGKSRRNADDAWGGVDEERGGGSRVQKQEMLTADQLKEQQKQRAFDAEMQQRLEIAKDKKEAMMTFNDILGDLNGLANDIGLQL